MKPTSNKLSLTKSTIANLGNTQLNGINGGAASGFTCNVDIHINLGGTRGYSGSIGIRF